MTDTHTLESGVMRMLLSLYPSQESWDGDWDGEYKVMSVLLTYLDVWVMQLIFY